MIIYNYQINKHFSTVNYPARGLMLIDAYEGKAAIPMDIEEIGNQRNADKNEIITCNKTFS